jgi:hypothetical protein
MSESVTTPAVPVQSPVVEVKPAAKVVEPKKLELTEAELEQKISDRLASEKAKAEDAETTRKAEEKAARDKEKGEFKTLYETTIAERDMLKLDLRKMEGERALRSVIDSEAKDYATAVKYMAPLLKIKFDTTDEDIKKQATAIVRDYVKDNPRGGGTLKEKPTGTTNQSDPKEPDAGSVTAIRNHFQNRMASM